MQTGAGPREAYWFTEVSNLGDLLSPVVLECYTGFKPDLVKADESPKWLGIGSILDIAMPGDWIWGTGTKYLEEIDANRLKVAAVRGPLTASLMKGLRQELALGDPAILLPKIYKPNTSSQEKSHVGFIPHYVDQDLIPHWQNKGKIIDITNSNWRETVDSIAGCRLVVSSSLHGIIVAEAYGVQAVWIQPSEKIFGGHHKFQDYYASTGRVGVCRDWALTLEQFIALAEQPPDLSSLQKGLEESLNMMLS